MFDYMVVGAGFAGSVIAERLAAGSDKKVLIVPFTGLRDLEGLGRKVVELVANNRRLP